jgi:hypothetical protein
VCCDGFQAADTGNLFGSYIAVSWPKRPKRYLSVPDPSGLSFMFSLNNKYKRPFRLSLVDRSRAISVDPTCGPMFGGEVVDDDGHVVKSCNLMLMQNDEPANETESNGSNHHDDDAAYQLDTWLVAPPIGFTLNDTTLAGTKYFAADEIECYLLY